MKKEKITIKAHLGIHIPLEICDKCKHRCENYGKDHEGINKKRREIIEYITILNNIPVYNYCSVPDMYDALGFDCCHPNDSGSFSLNNSITIIDINNKTGGLIILSITNTTEDEWYKELKNKGKITYFHNI